MFTLVVIFVFRWKSTKGTVAALNYIPLNSTDRSPALIPYPDWESNVLSNDNKQPIDNILISIFRIDVDACDRLWVLDTGVAGYSAADHTNDYKSFHPPTLVIFDLKTDKVIRRYQLTPDQYTMNSLFPYTVSTKFPL